MQIRRPSRWLAPLFLLTLSWALPHPAAADRGRPTLMQGAGPGLSATYYTFVSDTGTLLRGARWSSDLGTGCPLPSHSAITNLRSLGLNTLHVYAETWNQGYSAGHCQSTIDQLVDWTAQDGLYLILTIGNGTANGSFNSTFAHDFWTFYAPRYATRTHVLYEIQNEAYYDFGTNKSQPVPANVITFEKDMYNLIRASAPSTPVLFFSYPTFTDANGVQTDVAALKAQIPALSWSNEAIAFHGYGGLPATENTLLSVLGKNTMTGWNGAPCVQTEFYDGTNVKQDVNETIVFEDHFTSWMTFLDLGLVATAANYQTPLDNAGVVWAADYGTWPATSAPPLGRTVSFLAAQLNSKYVSAPNSTTPLAASALTAGTAEKFTVVATTDGRWVGLRAQSNSQDVCADNAGASPLIANRSSVGFWEEFEWMQRPDGTVVLRARANNKIVSADLNRVNPPQLIGNRATAGPWERFNVTLY